MLKLKTILQPHLVFMPFVVFGFLCWLLPSEIIGVYRKSELSFASFALFVLWYSGIVFACLFARKVGRSVVWTTRAPHPYSPTFYYFLLAIATGGTIAAMIALGSFAEVMAAVREQQVNRLKEMLYSQYSAGFLTFRYAAALAGAYALYRIFVLRRRFALDYLAIALVLFCAFISARIMLIQTAFFFGFMFVNQVGNRRRILKLGRGRAAMLAIGSFVAIVSFTYVRSASTYKEELGITNPVAVTAVELSRYAGMPIQVTLGVGEIIAESNMVESRPVRPVYLAPTFFHPDDIEADNSGGVGQQWYLGRVDIPATLTTNSAFASLVGYLGIWAFVAMPIVCFFFALPFFALARLHTLESRLYQAVILYAFFELWRVYFFSSGSFIFLNVLLVGFFVSQFLTGRLSIGLRRPTRILASPQIRSGARAAR